MSTDAQVRAPLTKSIVELVDRAQPPQVRQALRERARAEVTRVEECSRVDWIPLEVQLAILDALREEIGQQRYEAFLTAHFAATIEQPSCGACSRPRCGSSGSVRAPSSESTYLARWS